MGSLAAKTARCPAYPTTSCCAPPTSIGIPQVRRVLKQHDIPVVTQAGPNWKRFPTPQKLTDTLVIDLYTECGLSLHHIGLLTGRPGAAAGAMLRACGVQLRPAGGRSPFMRRWREGSP
jgi:hypothetical protein